MSKKQISRIAMSLLYIVAGINHFIQPLFYVKIMPIYFPVPLMLVYISGAFEFLLGVLILVQKTRKVACWLIIAMLIAFLPVHIQMLIDHPNLSDYMFWISVLRLPLQFVLIKWAWSVSKN